jgi:hypothetical protein
VRRILHDARTYVEGAGCGCRSGGGGGVAAAAAVRSFVERLVPVFEDLIGKLDRRFTWSPMLAVRVIVDTYERSFESWLLMGNREEDFDASPYAMRTLPVLLRGTSEPVAST